MTATRAPSAPARSAYPHHQHRTVPTVYLHGADQRRNGRWKGELDASATLVGANGPVSLLGVFDGRDQLIACKRMWHT